MEDGRAALYGAVDTVARARRSGLAIRFVTRLPADGALLPVIGALAELLHW